MVRRKELAEWAAATAGHAGFSETVSERPVGPAFHLLSPDTGALKRLSDSMRLGFTKGELLRLRDHFTFEGRDPTLVEIAGIAQSWSEHCSYKSSRPFLKKHFGGLKENQRVLAMGDAGVMALDDAWAYCLRIESHNHPSAIEPYGGAATGIGGIVRDVLAMGAKPVALADPLFFGPLDHPAKNLPGGLKHPGYLFRYVVSGIADYGNRIGVPTVTGSITFDPAYLVNPLVNVACVGLVRRDVLVVNRATAAGQKLILAGGATGRDGIGGVTFASRELTGKSEKESRPAVQLGNPIMKEPLIHACTEAVQAHLVAGMKDLGGGGLATSSGELVHAGGFGSILHLDRVHLRESGLEPWEVWVSESQERMILAVSPENVDRVLTIFANHDVPAKVVGEVTDTGREQLYWNGKLVADLEIDFRVTPQLLERKVSYRKGPRDRSLKAPSSGWEKIIRGLLLNSNGASREPVIRLYDHEVMGRTVGKPLVGDPRTPTHADASVIRVSPEGYLGLAMAVGSAPRVGRWDATRGGSLPVEETARNLYAVGARPDALTNCLNFGNPENPGVMGDFDQAVGGIADAARDLGMAVPSGNVSFYNGGMGEEIPPTPVVLGVGILPDIRRMVTSDLKTPGNLLFVLGRTEAPLGGSLYLGQNGGKDASVPAYDAPVLRRMGEALLLLGSRGFLRSCHDVSEGGLATALPEMAFGGSLGFDVTIPSTQGIPPWRALVAEGGSRWIIEIDPRDRSKVEALLRKHDHAFLGEVTPGGGTFRSAGKVMASLDLRALYEEWRGYLLERG